MSKIYVIFAILTFPLDTKLENDSQNLGKYDKQNLLV